MPYPMYQNSEGTEPYLFSCPTCGAQSGEPCDTSVVSAENPVFETYHLGREGIGPSESIPPAFTVRFETLTAARAETLLRRNAKDVFYGPEKARGNRNLKPGRVLRYAKEMAEGYWEPTHQGIALDEEGYLIDGQHRLAGLVKANEWAERDGKAPVEVVMMVSYRVPKTTFYLLDAGISRQASQFMSGMYATQRGGLGRTVLGLAASGGVAKVGTVGKGEFPAHRLLHFLEDNPDVQAVGAQEFVSIARKATTRHASGKQSYFSGTSAVGLLVGGWLVGPAKRKQWFADIEALTEADRTGHHAEGVADDNPLRWFHHIAPVGGNMTSVNYMRGIHVADRYRAGLPLKGRMSAGEKGLTLEWLNASGVLKVDVSDLNADALGENAERAA